MVWTKLVQTTGVLPDHSVLSAAQVVRTAPFAPLGPHPREADLHAAGSPTGPAACRKT